MWSFTSLVAPGYCVIRLSNDVFWVLYQVLKLASFCVGPKIFVSVQILTKILALIGEDVLRQTYRGFWLADTELYQT